VFVQCPSVERQDGNRWGLPKGPPPDARREQSGTVTAIQRCGSARHAHEEGYDLHANISVHERDRVVGAGARCAAGPRTPPAVITARWARRSIVGIDAGVVVTSFILMFSSAATAETGARMPDVTAENSAGGKRARLAWASSRGAWVRGKMSPRVYRRSPFKVVDSCSFHSAVDGEQAL